MQKLLFIFPLLLSLVLNAQNSPPNPLGVRSHGIGNASVALNDINSLFNNQAGLADLENISLLFSGQETFRAPYSDNIGAGIGVPSALGAFGLSIHYFGLPNINQTKVGLAYARKLSENLSGAVQFDMLHTQISNDSKSNLFTVEIGVQYRIVEKLLLGLHLYNPIKLEIIEDEFLPTIIRLGGTYMLYERFLIHAELEKAIDYSLVLKSGLEVEIVHNLWFRTGFQNKPTTINAGTGYQFKKGFRFDLACSYQHGQILNSSGILGSSGLVPSIGFGFEFI